MTKLHKKCVKLGLPKEADDYIHRHVMPLEPIELVFDNSSEDTETLVGGASYLIL